MNVCVDQDQNVQSDLTSTLSYKEIFEEILLKYIYICISVAPNNLAFLRPWTGRLLKTSREKEKILVISNFSFSPQCLLNKSQTEIIILALFSLPSANALNLDKSNTFFFDEELAIRWKVFHFKYRRQGYIINANLLPNNKNLDLSKFKAFCRRQTECC